MYGTFAGWRCEWQLETIIWSCLEVLASPSSVGACLEAEIQAIFTAYCSTWICQMTMTMTMMMMMMVVMMMIMMMSLAMNSKWSCGTEQAIGESASWKNRQLQKLKDLKSRD